jgi:aryl-alcohol dehydrogenase-like predicted oxidoreductase
MNFGDGADAAESARILGASLDAGINFVDCADVYAGGESERILGSALKSASRRDEVILATKFHRPVRDTDPNARGSHRRHIQMQVEASLRNLQTDVIDLYQMHRPQPEIPIDETLRALDDLVRAGKIRYIGTSTFAAWQIVESLWVSKELGLNRTVCEQAPYNLLDRRIERELLPMCRTYDIGVITWAPLAGGLLTGRYRADTPRDADLRYASRNAPLNRDHPGAFAVIEKVRSAAAQKGVSMVEFALAWSIHQPGVTSAIIGPRTTAQLELNLSSLNVEWTPQDDHLADACLSPGQHISDYYTADFGPNRRWC